MKIINQSNNQVLAERATLAEGFFARLKGLLGQKDFPPGEALIIINCNSIHTFFMRFPIDVLFLDKEQRVLKIICSLPPFRFSGIYLKAQSVVELPAGTLEKTSPQIGDTLLIA